MKKIHIKRKKYDNFLYLYQGKFDECKKNWIKFIRGMLLHLVLCQAGPEISSDPSKNGIYPWHATSSRVLLSGMCHPVRDDGQPAPQMYVAFGGYAWGPLTARLTAPVGTTPVAPDSPTLNCRKTAGNDLLFRSKLRLLPGSGFRLPVSFRTPENERRRDPRFSRD